MVAILSLGRACRPAFQARSFSKWKGLDIVSTPLDWTVTPFLSVVKMLDEDFDVNKVLSRDLAYITPKSGSITCGYSGINFHHALGPGIVKKYLGSEGVADSIPPDALMSSPEWEKAVGRFRHTYANFLHATSSDQCLFLRWRRMRHANDFYSFGESVYRLTLALTKSSKVNPGFRVLNVVTKEIHENRDPIEDPVLDYLVEDSICSCTLEERKGFNGDMTGNFRGDEYSWRICLEKVCGDFYSW